MDERLITPKEEYVLIFVVVFALGAVLIAVSHPLIGPTMTELSQNFLVWAGLCLTVVSTPVLLSLGIATLLRRARARRLRDLARVGAHHPV